MFKVNTMDNGKIYDTLIKIKVSEDFIARLDRGHPKVSPN
jgi:hypothetical protein